MTLLFLFLSLLIGINIKVSIVVCVIEILALCVFVWYRFSLKFSLLCLITCSVGFGISYIKPNFNKEIYRSVVIETKENYYIVSSSLEKLYIYEKENEREIGDIIELCGYKKDLSFSTLESGFDFKEYLNNKGIYSELVVTNCNVVFSTPFKIKAIKKQFLNNFNEDTKAVVSTILFGESQASNTTTLIKNMHLYRLISNSGIFLYATFALISFLLSFLFKDKYCSLASIAIFGVYSIFTFPRFVVIKFLLLKVMRWINDYPLKKKFKYLDLLTISGIFFLLIDYHLGYQDSFLLAYLIPIISLFVNSSFIKTKKVKKKVILFIAISLFFIPFEIQFSNEFSPFSYLLTVVLVPFFVIYGILALLSFLHIPIYNGLNSYTAFINKALSSVNSVIFKLYVPPPNGLEILLYELILIGIIYVFSIKLKPLCILSSMSFACLFGLYLIPVRNQFINYVDFINVGQGDSCLIKYNNNTILIDTGGSSYKDIATECLIPFFKKNQIYKLDYVIITHNDLDHNGALQSLTSNFKVKNVINDYKCFPLQINGLVINNLNTFDHEWDDDNESSLVLTFEVSKIKYLVMGDAPKKIENLIIKKYPNLDCDVLKIGHHGSNTSSSETFIKTVTPNDAIISCGLNNNYGHPHSEVLSILKKHHIHIRRTDKEGTICYATYVWV